MKEIMSERQVEELSKSIMPIGLNTLNKLSKNNLKIIILRREIKFNEIREKYLEGFKNNRIDKFQLERVKRMLTWEQQEIINENDKLKKEILYKKSQIRLLKARLNER